MNEKELYKNCEPNSYVSCVYCLLERDGERCRELRIDENKRQDENGCGKLKADYNPTPPIIPGCYIYTTKDYTTVVELDTEGYFYFFGSERIHVPESMTGLFYRDPIKFPPKKKGQ